MKKHEHTFDADGGQCHGCHRTMLQIMADEAHEERMADLAKWKPSRAPGKPTGHLRFANGKLQQQFKTEWTRWDGSHWQYEHRLTWNKVPEVSIDLSDLSEPEYTVSNSIE